MLSSALALLGGAAFSYAQLIPTETATCPRGLSQGDVIQVGGSNDKWHVACDTEHVGLDLGPYVRLPTYSACIARCISTPGCVGAQWSSIDTHCQLHEAVSGTAPKLSTTAFTRIPLTASDSSSTSVQIDSPPVKSINVPQPRSASPAASCPEFLANNGVYTSKRRPDVSYKISCHTGVDGVVPLKPKLFTGSATDCAETCALRTDCIAITWAQADSHCRLLSTMTGFEAIPGVVAFLPIGPITIPTHSALSRPIATPVRRAEDVSASCAFNLPEDEDVTIDGNKRYQIGCNFELIGGDLGATTQQPDYQNCIARCDGTAGCVAASYNGYDNNCKLKSSIGSRKEKLSEVVFTCTGNQARQVIEADAPGDRALVMQGASNCPPGLRPGKIVSVNNGGDWYGIACDSSRSSTNIGRSTTETTWGACLERCNSLHLCEAASWSAIDLQCEVIKGFEGPLIFEKGNVFFFRRWDMTLPSSKRSIDAGAIDGHSLEMQEKAVEASCPPGLRQDKILSIDGGLNWYNTHCDSRIAIKSANIIFSVATPTWGACLDECNGHQDCVAAQWSVVDLQCELVNSIQSPIYQEGGNVLFFRAASSWAKRSIDTGYVNDKSLRVSGDASVASCPPGLRPKKVVSVDNGMNNYATFCDTSIGSDNIGFSTSEPTYGACLERCNQYSNCIAAQWSVIDLQCEIIKLFGPPMYEEKGNVLFIRNAPINVNKDSAFSNSLRKRSNGQNGILTTACPSDFTGGEQISIDGFLHYSVACGFEYTGSVIETRNDVSDYPTCIWTCSTQTGCIAVQWSSTDFTCQTLSSIGDTRDKAGNVVFTRSDLPLQTVTNPETRAQVAALVHRPEVNAVEAPPVYCMSTARGYSITTGNIIAIEHKWWYVYCDSTTSSKTIGKRATTESFDECAKLCSHTEGCELLQWNEDHKLCEFQETGTAFDSMSGSVILRHVFPELTPKADYPSGPTEESRSVQLASRQVKSACALGFSEGDVIYDEAGIEYQVGCETEILEGDLGLTSTEDHMACVETCSANPRCKAVVWRQDRQSCELKWLPDFLTTTEGVLSFFRSPIQPNETAETTAASRSILQARQKVHDPSEYGYQCGTPTNQPDWGLASYNLHPEEWDLYCNSTLEGPGIEDRNPIQAYQFWNCPSMCNSFEQCVAWSATITGAGIDCWLHTKDYKIVPKAPQVFGPWPALYEYIAAVRKNTGPSNQLDDQTLEKRGEDRGKRGVAYNDPNKVHGFRAISDKIKWGWNWYSTPYGQNCDNEAFENVRSMEGLNYVPNIWTSRDPCLSDTWFRNADDAIAHLGTNALLAFNEPDMRPDVGGSDMSVGDAIEGYRQLMNPYAGRVALGAPSTTYQGHGSDGGWRWLRDFIAACPDCHVDFIPIHFYMSSWGDVGDAVRQFQEELKWLRDTFGKPIWITEMGYSGQTEGEEIWFLRAMLDFFEGQDYIERYSYRTAEGMTLPDGSLSLVGYCYSCFRSGGDGHSCCLDF